MMLFLCGAIYFAKLWQQFLRIDVEESFFKSICTRSKEEFLEANFVDNLKLIVIQNFGRIKVLRGSTSTFCQIFFVQNNLNYAAHLTNNLI